MNDCKLFDLSFLGLIRASGDDIETFLQGQLTNDVKEVLSGNSQLSAYCTHKGRMIALMRMIRHDENNVLMALPQERLETVQQRLKMFILMSKVELEDISDSYAVFGLSGTEAPEILGDHCPKNTDETVTTAEGISITRIDGEMPRFILTGEAKAVDKLRLQLGELCQSADKAEWFLQDIRAGLPTVFEETAEAFVPQMTNLQLVNGISFSKGCYTGQEVVARMQYLGSLKRRMYHVYYQGDCALPGTNLYAPQSKSAQGAGKVVISAPTPEGQCEALIVTEIASAEANEVRLNDENGVQLKFLELPYSFDSTENA